MATQFNIYMVAPFHTLGEALERVFDRFRALDMVIDQSLLSLSETEEKVFLNGGWKEVVNTWPGVVFAAHRCGPNLDVAIKVINERLLSIHAFCSHRLLKQLFSDRTEGRCFYAPLIQLAVALDVRFAVGEYELEFDPKSEEQVAQAIWEGPSGAGDPSWFALIRQDALSRAQLDAKAGGAFEIMEWLGGYWMLEHHEFHAFYGR